MPSKSAKQHRFMEMIAHDPKKAKQLGIAQSVGKDFVAADKGKKFGVGGGVGRTQGGMGQVNKQNTRQGSIYGYKKEVPDMNINKYAGLKSGGLPSEINNPKTHHTNGGVPNFSNKRFVGLKGGGMAKDMVSKAEMRKEMAEDKKQDVALIKKAFKEHDAQEHKGGKGTKITLKKGGAIKETAIGSHKMGSVKTSSNRDGIAQRGKTKGRNV